MQAIIAHGILSTSLLIAYRNVARNGCDTLTVINILGHKICCQMQ